MSSISYRGNHSADVVTVELGLRAVERESGCRDVAIRRALAIDCPLILTALVRTDGSVAEWSAEWGNSGNTYWHLCCGSQEDAVGRTTLAGEQIPPRKLTDEQRETLIRIWGGEVRPFGVRGSCGGPVMAWVGADRSEIASVLGREVFLNG